MIRVQQKTQLHANATILRQTFLIKQLVNSMGPQACNAKTESGVQKPLSVPIQKEPQKTLPVVSVEIHSARKIKTIA